MEPVFLDEALLPAYNDIDGCVCQIYESRQLKTIIREEKKIRDAIL